MTTAKPYPAFEDFVPGEITTFGAYEVTREDVIAFAGEFDPQPFHLDEEAGRASLLGGLAASGWHSCSILMRMMFDHFMDGSTSLGSPGIDEVKWLRPLFPGDVLSVRREILDARPSASKPDRGVVRFRFQLMNQKGEVVMEQTNPIFFARRTAGGGLTMYDEIVIGERQTLGSYTFTAEAIVDFARKFDPQPFHLSAEEGAKTHFGGLVASGWHTGSVWMRMRVESLQRIAADRGAKGLPQRNTGPSGGFRNLKWLKPVRAGDTITYYTEFVDKRPLASRPGWGIAFSLNTGENQQGELVFAFDGSVFVPM